MVQTIFCVLFYATYYTNTKPSQDSVHISACKTFTLSFPGEQASLNELNENPGYNQYDTLTQGFYCPSSVQDLKFVLEMLAGLILSSYSDQPWPMSRKVGDFPTHWNIHCSHPALSSPSSAFRPSPSAREAGVLAELSKAQAASLPPPSVPQGQCSYLC